MVRLIDRRTVARLAVFSVIGAVAPICFLVGACLQVKALYDFPGWIVYVWPTSLMLMGVSGTSCPDSAWLWAMAWSSLTNIVLWVTGGFILCWFILDIPWRRLVGR
jgi:hypothetical protein